MVVLCVEGGKAWARRARTQKTKKVFAHWAQEAQSISCLLPL
jgi:hypothetical protein